MSYSVHREGGMESGRGGNRPLTTAGRGLDGCDFAQPIGPSHSNKKA
jgi:hypothetical protein